MMDQIKVSQLSIALSRGSSVTSLRTKELKEYLKKAQKSQVSYYVQVYSIATLPNIFAVGFLIFFIGNIAMTLQNSYQFENVMDNFLALRLSMRRVIEERDVAMINALHTTMGWNNAMIKEKLLNRIALTDEAFNDAIRDVMNIDFLVKKLAIIRSNFNVTFPLVKYELYERFFYDTLKYFGFQEYQLEQMTWENIDAAFIFLDYIKTTSIMTEIVSLYELYCAMHPDIVPWFVKLYGYHQQLLPYIEKGSHEYATFIQNENEIYFNIVHAMDKLMQNFMLQDFENCSKVNEQEKIYRSNKISFQAREHLSRCWVAVNILSDKAKQEFSDLVRSQMAYIIGYSICLAFVLIFGSNSIMWYGKKMKRIITTIIGISTVSNQKRAEVNEAKQNADKLLYNMMPMSVAKQLKKGIRVASGEFDEATILFTDIHNFENIVNASSPLQIVEFLDGVYNTFDDCLQGFDVYKVETIRDSYMVVSGIPEKNGKRHTWEIAELALNLVDLAKKYTISHMEDSKLQLRLGVHTGMVVVGIVGQLMPRYCLFGDTVNTASRMKSYSQNHVSVHQRFILEKRGEMEIKGKGVMTTFWLNGRRPDLSNEKKASFYELKI